MRLKTSQISHGQITLESHSFKFGLDTNSIAPAIQQEKAELSISVVQTGIGYSRDAGLNH